MRSAIHKPTAARVANSNSSPCACTHKICLCVRRVRAGTCPSSWFDPNDTHKSFPFLPKTPKPRHERSFSSFNPGTFIPQRQQRSKARDGGASARVHGASMRAMTQQRRRRSSPLRRHLASLSRFPVASLYCRRSSSSSFLCRCRKKKHVGQESLPAVWLLHREITGGQAQ
jgi:hypothetical protein